MARIFAYCDSPTAGTGFGQSAKHILGALHREGHEIVQLAVNHDPTTSDAVPWPIYTSSQRGQDPYALWDLPAVFEKHGPFDLIWTTFDPQVPFSYVLPGVRPQANVIDYLRSFKIRNPGLRIAGWFPIDGGPLSEFEIAMIGGDGFFDLSSTMSRHVHDLVEWTLKLRGQSPSREQIEKRIEVVPHAVDLDRYRIASDEERREAKAKLGFPPDEFLIVQVERNQQRKQVWLAYEILEAVLKRHPKVNLYQHCMPDEENTASRAGWNLPDLVWRYEGCRYGQNVRTRERQFTETEMVDVVYAAADVVLSTSAGEGFQYPLWEALACGRRILAPRDSARKAWLSNVPGATLYATRDRGMVVRHGYNRRMAHADVDDAVRQVAKMIDGKQKMRETPEASRAFVERTAALPIVEKWWVERMGALADEVAAERRALGVVVGEPEKKTRFVANLRAMPGLGDVVLMAPALRALKAEGGGLTVALPPRPDYRQLAQWLEVGDVYACDPKQPLEDLGANIYDVSSLWAPTHRERWSDPAVHRTDVVARFLGVEPEKPFEAVLPDDVRQQAVARLQQTYGVEPEQVVVVACESGVPGRTYPEAYVRQVCEQVLARDLVPVLVGRNRLPIERVGVLNLTGGTDLGGLIGMLGVAGAVVATDSAPLHFAAAMGTPVVGLFPLFPAESRMTYYGGPMRFVKPQVETLGNETWPAGKDAQANWVGSISPTTVVGALDDLLGSGEADAPAVHGEIDA